jgi:hypothetical protein
VSVLSLDATVTIIPKLTVARAEQQWPDWGDIVEKVGQHFSVEILYHD